MPKGLTKKEEQRIRRNRDQKRYRKREKEKKTRMELCMKNLQVELDKLDNVKAVNDIERWHERHMADNPNVWTLEIAGDTGGGIDGAMSQWMVERETGCLKALGYNLGGHPFLYRTDWSKVGGQAAIMKMTIVLNFLDKLRGQAGAAPARHNTRAQTRAMQSLDPAKLLKQYTHKHGTLGRKFCYQRLRIMPDGSKKWIWVSFRGRPLSPPGAPRFKLLMWETEVTHAVDIGQAIGEAQFARRLMERGVKVPEDMMPAGLAGHAHDVLDKLNTELARQLNDEPASREALTMATANSLAFAPKAEDLADNRS